MAPETHALPRASALKNKHRDRRTRLRESGRKEREICGRGNGHREKSWGLSCERPMAEVEKKEQWAEGQGRQRAHAGMALKISDAVLVAE